MSIKKGRLRSSGLLATPVQFPPGTVISFAGSTAPEGWMLCDGAAISRTDYAGLFAAIGTTHGVGDGSTTFNLPNTLGLVPRGAGSQVINGRTKDGGSLGNKLEDQAQKISGQFRGFFDVGVFSSTSSGSFSPSQFTARFPSSTSSGGADKAIYMNFDSANSPSARASSTDDGETRPSSIAFNFIIKV
jgi:microcystin-dependent protein